MGTIRRDLVVHSGTTLAAGVQYEIPTASVPVADLVVGDRVWYQGEAWSVFANTITTLGRQRLRLGDGMWWQPDLILDPASTMELAEAQQWDEVTVNYRDPYGRRSPVPSEVDPDGVTLVLVPHTDEARQWSIDLGHIIDGTTPAPEPPEGALVQVWRTAYDYDLNATFVALEGTRQVLQGTLIVQPSVSVPEPEPSAPAGAPTLFSVAPESVPEGTSGTQATVYGENFDPGAVVVVSGPTREIESDRPTTFENANTLRVQLLGEATTGSYTASVRNGDGQRSNLVGFEVTPPLPAPDAGPYNYVYSVKTARPNDAGEVTMDSRGDQANPGTIYLTVVDSDGLDHTGALGGIVADTVLGIQQADDATKWQQYLLAGPPTVAGSGATRYAAFADVVNSATSVPLDAEVAVIVFVNLPDTG